MPLEWKHVLPDIFFINDGDTGALYSPLTGKMVSVDVEGQEVIKDFLLSPDQSSHPLYNFLQGEGFTNTDCPPETAEPIRFGTTELYLSLTSACNLRCIYCYAVAGENPRTLTWG